MTDRPPEQKTRFQRLLDVIAHDDEMREARASQRDAASHFRDRAIEWDAAQELKRRALHDDAAKFKEEALKWEANRTATHAGARIAALKEPPETDDDEQRGPRGRRPPSFRQVRQDDGTWEWEVIPDYSRGRLRHG
jgi:hypothetical protein